MLSDRSGGVRGSRPSHAPASRGFPLCSSQVRRKTKAEVEVTTGTQPCSPSSISARQKKSHALPAVAFQGRPGRAREHLTRVRTLLFMVLLACLKQAFLCCALQKSIFLCLSCSPRSAY